MWPYHVGMVNPVLIELRRGGAAEAFHRGRYAVWRDGDVVDEAGEATAPVFVRSGAKYFQALTCLLAGAGKRFSLNDAQLALMCASHGGEPRHVEVAASLLACGELDVSLLACGPHRPMHGPSARALRENGEEPTVLHNNCSGKHSGMMLAALAMGEDPAGYCAFDHPIQARIVDVMAELSGVDVTEITREIDGCSAPTLRLPLRAAARAYARFGAPDDALGDAVRDDAARLRRAVIAEPLMIAGHDRFCTALIEATSGRVLCKVGADGFYGAMVPELGMGIALHVDDGATSASERVLAAVLEKHGVIGAAEVARLQAYLATERKNHAGTVVGEVRSVL